MDRYVEARLHASLITDLCWACALSFRPTMWSNGWGRLVAYVVATVVSSQRMRCSSVPACTAKADVFVILNVLMLLLSCSRRRVVSPINLSAESVCFLLHRERSLTLVRREQRVRPNVRTLLWCCTPSGYANSRQLRKAGGQWVLCLAPSEDWQLSQNGRG